jgi:tRNA-uridine 2-sulfurtransferase
MAKVVIGLSGGVDSSVAAYLLKEQGHDVTALFMINWHDTTGVLTGDCPWDNDLVFAQMVAKRLEIPFKTVDLSTQYREKVVDYMFSEYEKGRTPNPDVLCNREIKFDVFIDEALMLGAEYVATGHYVRKETINKDQKEINRLLSGLDKNKDQSYFLCQLSQKQLQRAMFPIGDLQKSEVRAIAKKMKLASADKKDSQGICFVGKVDLPVFLQQKLEAKKGDIIEIPQEFYPKHPDIHDLTSTCDLAKITEPYVYTKKDGFKVGQHNGAHFFTIGQRKGINVGGKSLPLFVIATDTNQNLLYVGQGQEHPGLFRKGLFISKDEIHYVRPDLQLTSGEKQNVSVRHRYRQPLQNAEIIMQDEGLYILFANEQRGITPGQFAAWYIDDELIGSGPVLR